jgi:hypothetical protein
MNCSNHLVARRRHASARRSRQLLFEQFESRRMLAISTWTGGGGDDLWSNPANWDTVPVDGSDVRIAATGNSAEVHFDSSVAGTGVTINSLTSDGVNPVGEPLRITGDTLTLSGAGPFALGAGMAIASGTLSAANAVSINALNFSGGVLTGTGHVTIVGAMTWTSGIMSGSGQTTTSGSLAITANNQTELDGRTLNINGNTTLTGTSNWRGANGAVVNNAAVFEVQSDAVFHHLGGTLPTFNNLATGTFRKSSGTGVNNVEFAFNNSGAVQASAGTLSLNRGGTSTGSFITTATLDFSGVAATIHELSSSISGAGTVRFSGGTTNLSGGTYDIGGATQATAGFANFNAGINLLSVGLTLNVSNSFGNLNFSSGEAINVTTLNMSAGALSGSDNISVSGATTWTGGIMGGSGQTTTNGSLAITANNSSELAGRTLNINGSTTLTGTSNWRANNGAVINNTGVFDVQSDATFLHASATGVNGAIPTFNNTSTLLKSGGTGVTDLGFVFNNSSAVQVNAGTLSLNAGGASTGSLTTAGTLAFGGGTHNISANISGAGAIRFSGGTTNLNGGTYNVTAGTQATGGTTNFNAGVNLVNVGAALTVSASFGNLNFSSGEAINITTLNMSAGTLSGSDNLTISGATNWTGGIMGGNGQTTTNGSLAITANNSSELAGRTLNIIGGATVTAVGGFPAFRANNGAVINNAGLFDVQGDATLLHASAAGPPGAIPTFNNTGTFRKSAGTGITNVGFAFDNNGVVQVNTGTLSLSAGVVQLPAAVLTGGTWRVFSNSTLNITTGANISTNQATVLLDGVNSLFPKIDSIATNAATGSFTIQNGRSFAAAGAFANAGSVTIASGSTFSTAAGDYTQTGGTTTALGTLDPAASANIQGGTLAGTGNVLGNTINAATVTPGTLPGVLTVSGDYSQAAAGALAIEIGGIATAAFDQLHVSGLVTLGGGLNVSLLGGFVPNIGDSFRILNKTSVGAIGGTFAGLSEGATFPVGQSVFHITYAGGADNNDVVLTAVNIAPTLDPIVDPAAILEDALPQTVNLTGIAAGGGQSQTLTVTATSDNPGLIPNPTVTYSSPNGAGSLAYTPAANQSGSATITVTVKDNGGTANGGVDTITRTFAVVVTPVNDEPTLDSIADPASILEDAGLQTVNLTGISAGPSESQTLTVTATSNNPGLIPNPVVTYTSPNATGSLTYAPVANASGSAVITVTITDNGGTANGGDNALTRSFTVNVTPVNDAPTLDLIVNPAAILEDAGLQTINLAGISAGGGEAQNLTVTATSNNPGLIPNPTVTYNSPGSVGSLSYTPLPNQSGSAEITVTLTDSGGTADGGINVTTRTFIVSVTAVNDAPTLDPIADPAAVEQNAGLQTIGLTGISAGAAETQTLTITAVSNNPGLIPNPTVTYTSPSAIGSLAYTPVTNQSGSAVISVTVMDNGGTGNGGVNIFTRTFTVAVSAPGANVAPTLNPIPDPAAILEDAAAQTINLAGISAGASESQTLTVTATSDNPGLIPNPSVTYTSPSATGSLSYTPVANQSGSAVITITVTDNGGTAAGGVDTFSRSFTVVVTPVNDVPTLNPIPDPIVILEDAGVQTVGLSGISAGSGELQTLTVTATSSNTALIPDPIVSYASPIATGSLSYTPVANQSGTATITVTVTDDGGTANGGVNSSIRTFLVAVAAVNDAPTLDPMSDPAAIPQSAGLQTINLSGISAGAGESQTLTVTAVSDNPGLIPAPTVNYTSPGATGSLFYTPAANQSGSATITVTVMDNGGTANGGANFVTRTFTVTVAEEDANRPPTLDVIPDSTAIVEDAGLRTINLSGISAGLGESQTLTVTASSDNPGLIPNPTITYISPNATGSLSYTPVANQSGTATITVTVTDNGGTAGGGVDTFTRTFTVNVTPVNDAPILNAISNPAGILEDAGLQTINLSGISAGPGESQTLTITATSDSPGLIANPAITYISPNATGSLSYAPVANQSGTATITVTVTDSGGTANGGVNAFTRTFTVIVSQVNDAPTFNAIPNPGAILEDVGTQTINLSGISAGPDESQTLTISATSDNPGLIPNPTITYTSPNATGSLFYTPVANQSGSAVITVTLTDSGSAANGGVNSITRTFTINVTQVNDAPTFAAISNPPAIVVGAGLQTVDLSGITAGPSESQALTITATSSNPALVPNPAVSYSSPSATGSLAYTPVPNQSGAAVITVTVRDSGGTANGGVDVIIRTFTVTVLADGGTGFDLSATNQSSIVDDPANPGRKALLVVGGEGQDALVIEPRPSNRVQIRVKQTGSLLGIFSSRVFGRIAVFGLAGNDTIFVDSRLTKSVEIHGGAGNDVLVAGNGHDALFGDDGSDILYGKNGSDWLQGGDGNDALFGGSGNDRLLGELGNDRLFGEAGGDLLLGGLGDDQSFGGAGSDVLIGGGDADRLFGEQGDDVLIGGSTIHDTSDAALNAILVEWSSRRSFSARINNLRSRLDSTTVIDDGARDQLRGDSGRDWYLDFELADLVAGFVKSGSTGDRKN